MQKSEIVMLLTFKHSVEGGEVVESEVEAWYELIGDLDYVVALAAVRDHYRDAEVDERGRAPRLMPRHITQVCVEPVRSSSWVGNVTEARLAREAKRVTS